MKRNMNKPPPRQNYTYYVLLKNEKLLWFFAKFYETRIPYAGPESVLQYDGLEKKKYIYANPNLIRLLWYTQIHVCRHKSLLFHLILFVWHWILPYRFVNRPNYPIRRGYYNSVHTCNTYIIVADERTRYYYTRSEHKSSLNYERLSVL